MCQNGVTLFKYKREREILIIMILATTERSAGIITLFIIVWEIFDLRWFVLEKNEIVIERVFTQEELTFERRILIYERACSSLPLIQDVLKSNDTSFETLINLHAAVLDVNTPFPEVKQAKCIPNNINTVFFSFPTWLFSIFSF